MTPGTALPDAVAVSPRKGGKPQVLQAILEMRLLLLQPTQYQAPKQTAVVRVMLGSVIPRRNSRQPRHTTLLHRLSPV
jgi:hypothetical protein